MKIKDKLIENGYGYMPQHIEHASDIDCLIKKFKENLGAFDIKDCDYCWILANPEINQVYSTR